MFSRLGLEKELERTQKKRWFKYKNRGMEHNKPTHHTRLAMQYFVKDLFGRLMKRFSLALLKRMVRNLHPMLLVSVQEFRQWNLRNSEKQKALPSAATSRL